MIHFFRNANEQLFAVDAPFQELSATDISKLNWLFGNAQLLETDTVIGTFVGPRASMVTPWSTNAVEITQNMQISGIQRIEMFSPFTANQSFDPMLSQKFENLTQEIFQSKIEPEAIQNISDIAGYNKQEGLALSDDEVQYLENLSTKLGRPLTDSEIFGFSQVNSEHCRHKIFNGTFVIDGQEQSESLFKLIKKTSAANPNTIVSAYKDNVAFTAGPIVEQFAPKSPDKPDFYTKSEFESVLSIKAETHNFPTTVEPFNGAATGSGGEIRDRLAGGQGAIPLTGSAVYMTSFPRLERENYFNDNAFPERKWLYQTPVDILIKASNGASDFGNKFGQPLINGSLFTFEHSEQNIRLGYDKVIMQAGGVGYGKRAQALKKQPENGDAIVVLGGDNYRIGMGGAAVSSADTGAFSSGIELNAIQRSNPEMQKRAANAIRALVETDENPIVSIHDHGAGGHLNCLSELIEATGGHINLDALPVGDPSLSAKEIIGNESQERMGLVIKQNDKALLQRVSERERAPFYEVGQVTNDHKFIIESKKTGEKPMDFDLHDMFGSAPKTVLTDERKPVHFAEITYNNNDVENYIKHVIQLESVASKDWLTNKVDRCVGGRVAKQQCVGELQLPLSNYGISALDFQGTHGIANSIGHAPIPALIDAAKGSRLAIAEALTNLVWAPLKDGIHGVSLSANWMWPCKNPGEDARLYDAVAACSEFAIALGINIPTGKDSLSMKQKYADGDVLSPGTVIISAAAHTNDFTKAIDPVFKLGQGSVYYVNLSASKLQLGGSAFAQTRNAIGTTAPDVADAAYFKSAFTALQDAILQGAICAGHDVSSGGLVTTLLELCFASTNVGATIDLTKIDPQADFTTKLFAENTAVVIQATNNTALENILQEYQISFERIGEVTNSETLIINDLSLDIKSYRKLWNNTSYLFDRLQTANGMAEVRAEQFDRQALNYRFPDSYTQVSEVHVSNRPKAAVIREQGSNSEREMAHAMYLAGFDVIDIHMTDLITGRIDLSHVQFIGAVGGFSNSDVLGSAKGWAGSFKYNEKSQKALSDFYARPDTLSVGICNGCQLLMELEVIHPELPVHGKMKHNVSRKHESIFTSVEILPNNSVMLGTLAGSRLGVWVSHGEGRFELPGNESEYHIVSKYAYAEYPANPNGSDFNTAMLASKDGRHLVMMPHIERSIFGWNWAHYPNDPKEATPWLEAFVNARKWIENR